MLNQLIESKNHKAENSRKNGFLVGTLGVLIAVLMSGWTYSLFAKNFGMGASEFELSNIVAPVAAVEEAPPPKPESKPERTQAATSNKIILKDLYDDVSSSKNPPKELSGEKEVVSATRFDLSKVKLGDVNQIPENTTGGRITEINTDGCALCPDGENTKPNKDEEKEPEVVVKAAPKPTPKKEVIKSLGVINGKATYLATPPYPQTAKTLGLSGAVSIQVTIDEKGNVVAASVVDGHPLLRAGALSAARQSKFSPTYLSNEAVKVTGVIVYHFKGN